MSNSIPASTLEKFTTFGDLLRFLRRRAGITQLELSIAVGYSGAQISRLEQNLRIPDIPTIQARFLTPLCLENEPNAMDRLLHLAATVRREDAPTLGMCPYKGLDFFDEADADLFVGREALTAKLVEGILALISKEQANQFRFFAIVGASGSGKSSLVRAGLVPAIRWNKASSNWPIHVLPPTAHPLVSLAISLTRENNDLSATTTLIDDFAGDPRALSRFLNQEVKNTPEIYLMLVVDQFEELFTLCRSEAERSSFIDSLLTAASDVDGKAIVIITLRADFYAHCSSYLHLRQALATHQEYIGALNDDETRRVIEEPARRGHWELEPGLVELILHDVGHEPGALPLLSHALLETWQRRHGHTMTLSGYTSSGGVRGAIAETAESVFTDQFTPEQQAIARRIFLRLTELGDETATGDTRRRATFDELILRPEEKEATEAVLKALADARLVTTSEDSVQVAHEALIREWPTLRGWLEDNREGLRLHRQLTEMAQDWQTAGGEPDMLFRGARLVQAREWANSHEEDMNPLEKEFLATSLAYSEREAADREAARQRELESARQLAEAESKSKKKLHRRAIYLSLALAFTFILVVVASIFARQATINAEVAIEETKIRATAEARAEAESDLSHSLSLASSAQSLNTAGQGDLALSLAMEAVKLRNPPPEALTALRAVASGFGRRAILSGLSRSVQAVAVSPMSNTIFSGSCAQMDADGSCIAGELILWDLDTQKELRRWLGHAGWITAVTFSPDGQSLISGAGDGSLIQWDLDGENPRHLTGHTSKITDLAIIPGTGNLLSSSTDDSMILWDLKTSQQVMRFESPENPVTSIAYAADKAVIVSAHQDGSLMLWDTNGSKPIKQYSAIAQEIAAVATTPDASRIIYSASGFIDINIGMIDGESGVVLAEKTFGCLPGDMVFDSERSYILLACTTSVLQIDVQRWELLGISTESPGKQNAIAIAQGGRLGISASEDGTINLWNLGAQPTGPAINIEVDGLLSIAISPDNKYLLLNDASKNRMDDPALWDISARKIVRTYVGFDGSSPPESIAISPDNRFIAIAGVGREQGRPRITMWERENENPRCKFEGLPEPGRALAFSPDSKYLLVGSIVYNETKGHLILLDTECNVVRKFNTSEEVTSISFSADGTRVATGSSRLGRAVIWDVATGEEVRRFPYATSGLALDVAFGPGDTSILGSGSGELYLWDVETGNLLRRFTTGVSNPCCVAISPDGKYVVAGLFNGDVTLWDFVTGEKLNQININSTVTSVVFSSDSKTAYASSRDGKIIEWQIGKKSLPELLDWIKLNRFVHELTCDERQQYRVAPLCKP